jgi:hypothetical protein
MDHLLPQSPDTLVLVLPRLARGCCHARFACKRAFLAYTRHFDFSSTLYGATRGRYGQTVCPGCDRLTLVGADNASQGPAASSMTWVPPRMVIAILLLLSPREFLSTRQRMGGAAGLLVCDSIIEDGELWQPANPIPQRSQVLVVDSCPSKLRIQFDGVSGRAFGSSNRPATLA